MKVNLQMFRKTKETLDLYRAGVIKPGPITKYDVSEIPQAFRAFSAKDRIGKIVVNLENKNSHIPVSISGSIILERVHMLI